MSTATGLISCRKRLNSPAFLSRFLELVLVKFKSGTGDWVIVHKLSV